MHAMEINEKKRKGDRSPPFCSVQTPLFIQVGADSDVATALLPLACDVIVLRAFLRGALSRLVGDFRHVTEITGELDAVIRNHLRGGNFVHFLNFGAVRERDGVTSTFRGLRFKETAYASAGTDRCGRRNARNFHFLSRFSAFCQRGASGF